MLDRNLFPNPSPLLAPFTKPAISTISNVVGCTFQDCTKSANLSILSSGTANNTNIWFYSTKRIIC